MPVHDLLADLNDSQRAAVTHLDGPLLILAGPGSGKTRVITHRIAYMIQQGVAPQEIVGLTFTNKAAGEMRSRLETLAGDCSVWLGTFHGFCARLLRRYARLVGLPENFSIYDVDDAQTCLKQAIDQASFELTHASLATLAHRISYFKNRLITPEILEAEALRSDEFQVARIYPFYQRALLRNGAVDFDDLLLHTAMLLRQNPELRQQLDQRFRYLLVDEYQDTNLAQYVILRNLCSDHQHLAATGDPDQSIYGWRGASHHNVALLERDYADLQVIRLEDNYRSTPEILSVADCLIRNNEYRKHKELVPSRPTGGDQVRLTVYPSARAEAEDIADQIVSLVQHGQFRLRDFGILYRTNAQSRLLEQAMLRRQLPYQLIGGYRFYLRKEIKDLIGYLLLVHNPEDDVALQRIINLPPRGIGKQSLRKLTQLAERQGCSLLQACQRATEQPLLSAKTTKALKQFLQLYETIVRESGGTLVGLLQATLDLTGYREYLSGRQLDGRDSAELFQNIDELLAEAYEQDQDDSDQRPALERFLENAALQADTDKLKLGAEVVTLMTLHAAKGLEFPCVYIVAVEENILPHSRSKDDPAQLEEERRLLFVGITRARDRLQLSYAKSRGFGGVSGSGVPSSFLMELPRREMLVTDRSQPQWDEAADWDPAGDDQWETAPHADEWCQVEPVADDQEGFDEHCQLPPEELKQRLMKRARRGSRPLTVGSKVADQPAGWGRYRAGMTVTHPTWGAGEILSASGLGGKRSVTVRFFDSGDEKTFRLSHASLTLTDRPTGPPLSS